MKTNKPYKTPFKLEDFGKKEMFSVPDGYFEKLPTIIQTRAIESTIKKALRSPIGVLKLALPSIALLLIVGYFGYKYQHNPDRIDSKIEAMIADISTEDLVIFLGDSDVTSDELLELVSFEGESLEDLPTELDDISDEDLELLIYDFENENSI